VVNHERSLAGRLSIDIDRALFKIGIEPVVIAFQNEAFELCKLRGTPESLQILAENLIGGGRAWRCSAGHFEFIRVRNRRAVLNHQTGSRIGMLGAAVARVTGNRATSAKVGLVQILRHHDHLAGDRFFRSVQGIERPVAGRGGPVTIDAVQIRCRGKEAHGVEELIHRHPLQEPYIFIGLLGQLRTRRCLPKYRGGKYSAQQG